MGDLPNSQLSEAMNKLWQKFLPQMEERLATLQSAAARMAAGARLSEEEQATAAGEAHKLAGVLGTFGLKEGTDLAREAELLYGGDLDTKPETVTRLVAIGEKLKAMVANR